MPMPAGYRGILVREFPCSKLKKNTREVDLNAISALKLFLEHGVSQLQYTNEQRMISFQLGVEM